MARTRAMLMGFGLAVLSAGMPAAALAQDLATPDVATPNVAAVDPLAPLPEGPIEDNASADSSSTAAAEVARWINSSRDNNGLPFIIIDKIDGEVFAYDALGAPVGAAPALVGITPGDDSTPGVGDRELSHIPVKDRTTPAGRFFAKFGPASGHQDVLWIDYAASISLHPVITTNPKERRMQRIKSPTSADNRITFGCINVPAAYYAQVVRPLMKDGGGVVYILPDTKPLRDVFPTIGLPAQQAAAF